MFQVTFAFTCFTCWASPLFGHIISCSSKREFLLAKGKNQQRKSDCHSERTSSLWSLLDQLAKWNSYEIWMLCSFTALQPLKPATGFKGVRFVSPLAAYFAANCRSTDFVCSHVLRSTLTGRRGHHYRLWSWANMVARHYRLSPRGFRAHMKVVLEGSLAKSV